MRNPGLLMDVRLEEGAKLSQEVPRGWNGFCYVYEGSGRIGGAKAKIEQNLVMGDGAPPPPSSRGPRPFLILLNHCCREAGLAAVKKRLEVVTDGQQHNKAPESTC